MWVPTSATLVYGERDAVLVDAMLTVEQAHALVDSGCRERQEPDYDLCYPWPRRSLLWPRGALSSRGSLSQCQSGRNVRCCRRIMQQQTSPEYVANFWNVSFPANPGASRDCREAQGKCDDLKGRDVVVVEVGHTDTDHTTCLHVPSVGLVVAWGCRLERRSSLPRRVRRTRRPAASGSLRSTQSSRSTHGGGYRRT